MGLRSQLRQIFVRRCQRRKRPRPHGDTCWPGQVKAEQIEGRVRPFPLCKTQGRTLLKWRRRRPGNLFVCAKTLLVEAMAPTGPGTKTFEIDQSFEPSARNRRPTAVGAALKMSASSMSDDFDGLDATEKAAVEALTVSSLSDRCFQGRAVGTKRTVRERR